jgi:hypothetical protein
MATRVLYGSMPVGGRSDSLAIGNRGETALDLTISPQAAIRFLLACIIVLVFVGSMAAAAMVSVGEKHRLLQLFALGGELSIPTYFSSLLLLAAGCLLGLIARENALRRLGWHLHWTLLALGFVWLSFDEAASIHEAVNPTVRIWLGMSFLDGAAWTAVAAPVVSVLAVLYLPFLLRLPPRYMRLFVTAGAIYLGSAMGAELVGQLLLKSHYGGMSWPYRMAVVVEEGCEMLGVACLIYGLITYLAELGTVVRLRIAESGGTLDGTRGKTPSGGFGPVRL